MRRHLTVALVLAVSVLGAACGEEQPATRSPGGGGDAHGGHEHEDAGGGHAAQGTKEIGGFEATFHGSADVSAREEFELELDDSYYGPTVLKGESGQELSLDLHNEGAIPHTFTVDGARIDEELPSGAEGISIDVTFPATGALVFYCRFHREQGMVGALSVDGSLEVAEDEKAAPDGAYG